jgi:hypothetical protein
MLFCNTNQTGLFTCKNVYSTTRYTYMAVTFFHFSNKVLVISGAFCTVKLAKKVPLLSRRGNLNVAKREKK